MILEITIFMKLQEILIQMFYALELNDLESYVKYRYIYYQKSIPQPDFQTLFSWKCLEVNNEPETHL